MRPFYPPYMIMILFLWTCGIYLTLKEFYSSLQQEDRIEYLQNELKRVKHQLDLKIECSNSHQSKKFIKE